LFVLFDWKSFVKTRKNIFRKIRNTASFDRTKLSHNDCFKNFAKIFFTQILIENPIDYDYRTQGLKFFMVKWQVAYLNITNRYITYRAFHRFGQAKFPDGGSILGSKQFLILSQLPSKILLNSKVVKINQKIIILLCKSKSVTHSVWLHIWIGFEPSTRHHFRPFITMKEQNWKSKQDN